MTDSGQWLYKIQVVRPEMLTEGATPEEDDLTTRHFNYLKDLAAKGVVILAGRTLTSEYSGFGLIIFKANSEAAAREIVQNDPGVKHKVFRAELFPYRIAVMDADNA